eukprot:1144293-Pelagomonas_calceolata.AAC.1
MTTVTGVATVVSKARDVHGGLANHQIDEMRLKCTGYPRDPSANHPRMGRRETPFVALHLKASQGRPGSGGEECIFCTCFTAQPSKRSYSAAVAEQLSGTDSEDGELQPEFAPKVGAGNAKWMPKPATFTGAEDVDETLFTFETYFGCTGQPKSVWPQLVLTLLADKARSAWLALAVPHNNSGNTLTWDMFCKCMREAFAAPDKKISARMQLHHVQQHDMPVKEYVRQVRSLIAQTGANPPSSYDCLLSLYDGLNANVKQESRINLRTGKFWTDFEAFANHVVILETHMHKASKSVSFACLKGVQKFKPYSRVAVASQAKPPPKQAPKHNKAGPSGSGGQHGDPRKKARNQGSKPLGAALARVQVDAGDELILAPDPSPPPDISWPIQFGTLVSFPASEVFAEAGFVRLLDPCRGNSSSIALSDYLATDIAGLDVMLATQPQHFATALQHYLDSKSKSNKDTS